MLKQAAQVVGRVYLLGPFTVLDASGRNCTPKGQKTQALLAMLALAPRGTRSRAWLRDKLWSDRGEQQASGSLRQALTDLRRCLRPLSSELIASDNQSVSLDLSRIRLDVHDLSRRPLRAPGRDGLDFLEGIDIRDPEFEDWLSIERRYWLSRLSPAEPAISASGRQEEDAVRNKTDTLDLDLAPARIGIGLLPSITQCTSESVASIADLVLEGIVSNLNELVPLDIYDYRDCGSQDFGVSIGPGPDLILRMRVQQVGDDLRLTLLAYRTVSQKLIWSHSVHADQTDALRVDTVIVSGFISQNVDRLAHVLFNDPRAVSLAEEASGKAGYAALNLIFQVDDHSIECAENLLTQAYRRDTQSVFLGLLAYISSFRVGEHIGEFNDVRRLAALSQSGEALKVNPFNSITLACIGHVYGYVMRDFPAAGELLQQAIEINPHQAFSWDHYALFNIYTGQYEAALRAARTAVYLGSFSPLRYSFETTLAMAATMSGDYNTAIHYGNRALSRQPRFAAAMRYLVACYGHAGAHDKAGALLDRLYAINPAFSQESVRQNSMAINDEAGRQRLLQGFALAGVKR